MDLLYFHADYYYHLFLSLSSDLRIFLFNSNGCSFFIFWVISNLISQKRKAGSNLLFGTQNPNPNPNRNPERQMGDVLCIFSLRRVFVVDMEYIMSDEDYKEGTPLKRLPVKRTIDFLKSRLPLGMGLAKSRNLLYMFGGNHPSERDKLGSEPDIYRHNLEEDPPCHAFMLDLADDTSKPVRLSSMWGPKLYPMVEVIGDNIYVLSEILLSGELPMFEVYNPITEIWRILPQPFPPSGNPWKLQCYSVCGSVITCKISSCYCRFNTITEEWEYPEDITTREQICMFGRPDVRNKDLYITRGGDDDDFWAMDERAWPTGEGEDGCSIRFKPYDIYPLLPGRFERLSKIKLADTSDHGGYLCGIVGYGDYGSEEDCYYPIAMALHIIVFQVKKRESGMVPAPLSIRYLRRQVYEFKSEDELQPHFAIRKAVM